MPTDQSSAHDLANRRMVLGLLLSLLAHALILSIGFGLSGMRAGGAGPIAVSLAPLPSSSPAPEAPAPAAEVAPSPPPAALTERPPEPGFRLLDPIPMAPPPAPSQAPARPARRRREPRPAAPRREAAPTPVIVQQDNPDAAFKVPLADEQADPAPAMQVPEEPAPLVAEAAPDPEPDRRAADDAAERLRVWDRLEVSKGETRLRITSVPGRHGAAGVAVLLPKVMGSVLDFGAHADTPDYRMYISGDTLVYDDIRSIPQRFPGIDLALLHLGGTRILGVFKVTMDGKDGVQMMQIVKPKKTIPIHYNDYDVFKSPLAEFAREVKAAGLEDSVVYLAHGDTYTFTPRTR